MYDDYKGDVKSANIERQLKVIVSQQQQQHIRPLPSVQRDHPTEPQLAIEERKRRVRAVRTGPRRPEDARHPARPPVHPSDAARSQAAQAQQARAPV